MRNTIMTEKIVRRGTKVPAEYAADFLEQTAVSAVASRALITLTAEDSVGEVRAWLHSGHVDAQHQGYPVLDRDQHVRGVVTRRDLLDPSVADTTCIQDVVKRPLLMVREDQSLRDAADLMVQEKVGRLLVVANNGTPRMVGIITRADLLGVHAHRLAESHDSVRSIRLRRHVTAKA
jgi:predicted transcriptional regulator